MTRYLLDTNVISCARRIERQDVGFQRFMAQLRLEDSFISAISVTEIRCGIQRQRTANPDFAAELTNWLEKIVLPRFSGQILPFDETAANLCGQLAHSTIDAMIGSTAAVNGMVVATRNIADFQPLGIAVVNPWDTPD